MEGGAVVTMDPECRVIEDGVGAIRGDPIVAVGTQAELAGRYAPASRLDGRGS